MLRVGREKSVFIGFLVDIGITKVDWKIKSRLKIMILVRVFWWTLSFFACVFCHVVANLKQFLVFLQPGTLQIKTIRNITPRTLPKRMERYLLIVIVATEKRWFWCFLLLLKPTVRTSSQLVSISNSFQRKWKLSWKQNATRKKQRFEWSWTKET